MSTNTLIQTLEQLRLGGTLDSSGRFSLDPLRAREVMERYRLADPSLYVLSLVASAVAGNASFIKVGNVRSEFELIHDGLPPARETLEGLFTNVLLAQERSLTHFELAVALNGALALDPRAIIVEAYDQGWAVRLNLADKQHQVEDFHSVEPGRRGVRVVIRKSRKFRLWGNKKVAAADEMAVLEEFCCYCPIPILMGGKMLNRTLRWSPSLALRALTSDIAPPVAYGPPHFTPVFVEEKGEVPYSAVFSIGRLTTAEPGLILVVNGVSFAGDFRGFTDCPVHAVVNLCTAGLQKDVSQSGLVRNDGYEVLMASLRVEVLHTLEQLAQAWSELSDGARLEALPMLDLLAKEWTRQSALDKAVELYRKLLIFRVEQFGEHHQEVLSNFANLSVVNLLLGKAEQAREMMAAVAWDLTATGQHARARIFFEKTLELYEGAGLEVESPQLAPLLQAYGRCLQELGLGAEAERVLQRLQYLERTWKPPSFCRCCGHSELQRGLTTLVEGRATRADVCPRCGYGEFQLEAPGQG